MPEVKVPPIEPMSKASTQAGRILQMLKRAGQKGVMNYELSRVSLQYTSRIYALRHDEGHNILCEQTRLKNGRASNTFKYTLIKP